MDFRDSSFVYFMNDFVFKVALLHVLVAFDICH